jgi:diguanylate cyclase (GGDEF)-like protein
VEIALSSMDRLNPVGIFIAPAMDMKRRRGLTYALLTAAAAVTGLLLLRAPFRSGSLTADFLSNRYVFAYLFVAIAATFLGLGYVLARQADRLRHLSSTDALTGLCNRRALDHVLRREWDRAVRYRSPLALLLIDIDGLKQVNDALGHRGGDDLLRRAGAAIRESLRGSDIGARWGGDEFAILAPETSREAAQRMADRLLARLKGGVRSPQDAISASIGVAVHDPASDQLTGPEALMQTADEVLYAAKAGGRDQVKVA